MAKFRKKPIIIEAFQMTKERRWDNKDWPQWLHEAWNKDASEKGCFYCDMAEGKYLFIKTLEGDHTVSYGDYIIQGVEGELYACKPDIFEKTYHEHAESEEFFKKGVFFKAKTHICRYFLIEVQVKIKGSNAAVAVYETGIPQDSEGTLHFNNGDEMTSHETELLFKLDIWNKYYFPTFNNENNQWYHNEEGNEDHIQSTAEVMEFALQLGLKDAEINTY